MRKDIIKSLIAIRQSEIPFDVIERDIKLPVDRKKIITIPGVRRCGKSTMMEIAVTTLCAKVFPGKTSCGLALTTKGLSICRLTNWTM